MQHDQLHYSMPPYPQQRQPEPGLAGKMSPRPDHGETSYQGSGRLAGSKALITGGDSGIGRAVAIAFAREGADVVINYLPDEQQDADEVIALIRDAGQKGYGIAGDLRDEAFCQLLIEEAHRCLGGLDILINNAGKQQFVESILDLSTEQFDATFKTNVYAMFWLSKYALNVMEPGASIITTASVQAYAPSAGLLDYAQTKACNVAFTKALAKQLGPKGIRVNAVAPGPYWTPLQVCGGQPQESLPHFGADSPLGRAGQPAEIAPLYVTLASKACSYTSGQVWCSDGGTGTL
ncbi:SDR family oxidoreductase [Symbiopectobacterium purcellii]|uniref:SDR family oxidoreductase n=1 Tax=Symbiopectobacterium purcellii TaxID=2871826 RepID=A0ABX9AJX4_9ENTR|nr:SDR family oxidoreductase [Symbiopectobacterium purcellii]QZN95337.1 SDR family oxidoreductase [Symbiopectobacterium purcellii]